jgi:anaphase-promoting complex subunit 4
MYRTHYNIIVILLTQTRKGHKRWDKAVTSGLENLRKLVHENMLPALERCAVILSRLKGIVKFQGSNETIGFSSHQIDLVMDTVACLNLVSARILTYVVDEIDMFAAFSAWLRHEIDRLASDASSSPSEDIPEKESALDHSKVLLYIQTAMINSRLSVFFAEGTSDDQKDKWAGVEEGLPMFELLDNQLQKHEEGLAHTKELARLAPLCERLTRQATTVFRQIAEAEKRNVLFGHPISLGIQKGETQVVMRMCPQVRFITTNVDFLVYCLHLA